MILQTNPQDLEKFLNLTSKEVTLIGLLFIITIVLAYFLVKAHKKSSELQDSRLEEAKQNFKNLQAMGDKFMAQTSKMILVMELFKRENNGNN